MPNTNPEAEGTDNADLKLNQQDSSASGKQLDAPVSEEDRDQRSVFVKNVHYSATKTEIEEHFNDCGEIKLITIMSNKMTHQPLG
jgi:polyadenylate-binding protein 2